MNIYRKAKKHRSLGEDMWRGMHTKRRICKSKHTHTHTHTHIHTLAQTNTKGLKGESVTKAGSKESPLIQKWQRLASSLPLPSLVVSMNFATEQLDILFTFASSVKHLGAIDTENNRDKTAATFFPAYKRLIPWLLISGDEKIPILSPVQR